MRVGIPTEIKNNEFRVAITPAGVAELVHRGHEVLIQAGAGEGSAISDTDFKRAGAQVVGMSGDTLEDLSEFSRKECAGAFPVARATPAMIEAFDVALEFNGQRNNAMTSRTSYVIAPDGRIVYEYTALDPDKHVANTLAAVRKWAQSKP